MSGPPRPLRVLLVEDNPDDADLTLLELARAGFAAQSTLVDRRERMAAALAGQEFDVILCDHAMPDFSSTAALELLRELESEVPCIIVSGRIGEEAAADAMRRGARDYVNKERLDRLGPVIDRELQETEHRRARREAETALQERERLYRLLAENATDFVGLYDLSGICRYASPSATRVFGYAPEGLVGGNVWEQVHPDDQERAREAVRTAVAEGRPVQFVYRRRKKNGRYIWCETVIRAVPDDTGEGTYIQSSTRDITERKMFEAQLAHQALHDALTELPNRALLIDRVEHALTRAGHHNRPVAVICLGLDNLEMIVQSQGYETGDRLLLAVVERLRHHLRPGDTLGRTAPGEFTVLMEECRDIAEAVRLGKRLLEELTTPFAGPSGDLYVSSSCGIVAGAPGQSSARDLVRCAAVAEQRARNRGNGRCEIYDPSMGAQVQERLTLETELRQAVERQELTVHYQPILSFKTGRIAGLEALVRWPHSGRGLLLPGQFIPLAEESDLIDGIGAFVLRSACQQVRAWQRRYPCDPPLYVSVNVSPRQFRNPGLVDEVMEIIQQADMAPRNVQLEITETVMFENRETADQMLANLRRRGVRIAIDDFGTGYASHSYLRATGLIDTVKVDASFVAGIGTNKADTAIVEAVLSLRKHLDFGLVAEGIETADQLQWLKSRGCDAGQGYYLAGVFTPEKLAAILEYQRQRR